MTVLTTKSDISYAGIAGQTSFAYDFRVDNKADMNVAIDGVAVSQAGFTMTGVGSALGGTVTLISQLTDSATVLLFRALPITQETDYQPFDPFPAETHEQALDKLTMLIQQSNSAILSAIRFPVGDDADPVLPIVTDRAGRSFGFDANGDISLFLSDDSGDPQAVQKPIGAAIDNNLMMFDAFKNALDSGFSIASLIEMFLPIGSVLTYTNGTLDPNTFIPNTAWELMPEGEFLISQGASFPGGTTGGAADSVVVEHTHPISADGDHLHGLGTQVVTIASPFQNGIDPQSGNAPSGRIVSEVTAGQHQHTLTTTGVPGTDLNIPPYRSIWRWERVTPAPATPEFDAHWARVTDKSDPTLEANLRVLFADLIANGLWDIIDDLCVIHSNQADSLLGLKGFQDSVHAGPVPDWTIARGFRLGSTEAFESPNPNLTNWVDTGILSTPATNFGVNSQSLFFQMLNPDYTSGPTPVNRGSIGTVYTEFGASMSIVVDGDDLLQTQYSTDESNILTSTIIGPNFYLGTRESTTNLALVVGDNTVFSTTGTSNPADPANFTVFVGAQNDSGLPLMGEFYLSDFVMWGVGGGMSVAQSELLKDIVTTYTAARGISTSPEFDAHWARVTDKSDPTLETDLRALFTSLINSGVYALLDDLCVIHSVESDSLLGLKGYQDSSTIGAPVFDATFGFRCGKSAAPADFYITTNQFATGASQVSDNNVCIFCYRSGASDPTAGNLSTMGIETFQLAISTLTIEIQSAVNTLVKAQADAFGVPIPEGGDGFAAVSRNNDAANVIAIRNAAPVSIADNSQSEVTAIPQPVYVGGSLDANNVYQHEVATEDMTAWGVGAGLDATQLTSLQSAITTYLTARGVN